MSLVPHHAGKSERVGVLQELVHDGRLEGADHRVGVLQANGVMT